MSDFYTEFPTNTKEEWLKLAEVQLRGKSIEEALHHIDPIEEIEYKSYGFSKDTDGQKEISAIPQDRATTTFNDWINNVTILAQDIKEMNKLAHSRLMNGATGIEIDLSTYSLEEIQTITIDIGFEHIQATLYYATEEQYNWIKDIVNSQKASLTAVNTGNTTFEPIKNAKNFLVKAIDVQYAGGNTTQEVAYALKEGHTVLFNLISSGMSAKEANENIKFQFGMGSNYFFEINKISVFKTLWNTIVSSYAKDDNTYLPYIEARTGFVNKSLLDPHTNLLRQTTEALSAIVGGVNEVTIAPYNEWSNDTIEEKNKVQRLGLNIALLLKEESYLDKVVAPFAGSYIIEELYETQLNKAWSYFQQLENETIDFLKKDIERIAKTRIERTENKDDTLIGVNKFFNIEEVSNEWKIEVTTPFGKPLILEQDTKIEK